MAHTLTVRGAAGALLWGYQDAVVLSSWRISKFDGCWWLTGTITRVNKFQARQAPLVFAAPRPGGFWRWPIVSLDLGDTNLRAQLGPPER